MKRLIFILMIFVLVFSVFTMNTMLAFAEGESEETTGTEETLPEGGEEATTPDTEEAEPSEDETTPEGGVESEIEQETEDPTAPESGSEEELNGLFAEMGKILGDIKNDFVELVINLINFIKSDETYTNIATGFLAALAVIFVPILIAVLAIAYISIAAIVIVATALMSMLELIITLIPGVAFII